MKLPPGGIGQLVPYTPSCHELLLCWIPCLQCRTVKKEEQLILKNWHWSTASDSGPWSSSHEIDAFNVQYSQSIGNLDNVHFLLFFLIQFSCDCLNVARVTLVTLLRQKKPQIALMCKLSMLKPLEAHWSMVYGSMRCLYMCSLHPGSGTKAKAQVKEGGELLIRIKIGGILG